MSPVKMPIKFHRRLACTLSLYALSGVRAILLFVLLGSGPSLEAAVVRVDDFYNTQDAPRLADWNAANRAIAAAGTGGTVQFTSGSTYTLPFHITPRQSQTLTSDGPGPATIRRSDSLLTNLSADAPAGATYVDVVDPTRYTVGYYVTPLITGGLGGRTDGEPLYNRINAISGNRLHLQTPLTQAYSVGDRVVNQSRLIVAGNPSATLENLRIDGNRAGNDEFTNWATTIDVHLSSTGTTIRDVEFVDSPGGALSVHGSNHQITDSRFERINLAVAHFSVATNVTMERNRSFDTNSLAELGQHSTGAYEWSLRNTGITIRDSVVENADGWAFGHIRVLEGNSNVLIEGNIIRNNQGTLELRNSSAAGGNRNVHFRFLDNEVVDSGILHLSDANQTQPLTGITVEGNRFWNGTAKVRSIDFASISGNRWFAAQGGDLSTFLDVGLQGPNVTLDDNAVMTLPRPGDATLDGFVDRGDIAQFIDDFGREFGGNWVRGDFNFDGAVTIADLVILQKQLGSQNSAGSQATPVPEPHAGVSILCALTAAVAFYHCRMRRSSP